MNAGLATAALPPPPGPQVSAATNAQPASTKAAGEGFGAHLAKAIAVKTQSRSIEAAEAAPQGRDTQSREIPSRRSDVDRPVRAERAEKTDKVEPANEPQAAAPESASTAGSDAAAQAQAAAMAASQAPAPSEPKAPAEAAIAAETSRTTGPGPNASILLAEAATDEGLAADTVVEAGTSDLSQAASAPSTANEALDAKPQPVTPDLARLARQAAAEQAMAAEVQAEQLQAELAQSELAPASLDQALQSAADEAMAASAPEAPKVSAGSEQPSANAKSARSEGGLQSAPATGSPITAMTSTGGSSGGFSGEARQDGQASDLASNPSVSTDAAAAQPAPVAEASQTPIPAPIHVAPQTLQTAAVVLKSGPQTVSTLAAQIVSKFDGGATRFDLELHPLDLGRVDVRLEVGAGGQISASMSFDNPQAAAEMRSRSAELQKALENAGFNLSGGLSFDVAGDRGQGGSRHTGGEPGPAQRARALENAASAAADVADAASLMSAYGARPARGVDIRI
ncbi:MAG: hypothetical protein CFE28_13310 [Alphaproteobacteria bacterium PA2]|nr:MAG: hypothetical protein CFE28_13310 [Alphaproteobacteria bacterium PA2]